MTDTRQIHSDAAIAGYIKMLEEPTDVPMWAYRRMVLARSILSAVQDCVAETCGADLAGVRHGLDEAIEKMDTWITKEREVTALKQGNAMHEFVHGDKPKG